jgi:ankyrin repeat protein
LNKNGETSLHVAARYGHPHVVEHLCKLGGNVDCQDDVRYEFFFDLRIYVFVLLFLGRRYTFDCCCLA